VWPDRDPTFGKQEEIEIRKRKVLLGWPFLKAGVKEK
jgi:hypothetical protein